MAVYLDTSALVKLVVVEGESTALRHWLRGHAGPRVTSDLTRVELIRAVRTAGAVGRELAQARRVLSRVSGIPLSRAVIDRAGTLEPLSLRGLDAIHLASALMLGDQLEVVVTYDDRLAAAGSAAGVPVAAPG